MTTQMTYLPVKNRKQRFADFLLGLTGWRIENITPLPKKYLIVAAHHTSNWDLPVGLLFMLSIGARFHFIAKDEAFRWPLGGLMRWLGGIPVNRRSRNHFVGQIVEQYQQRDALVIAITPEGTRSKTKYWKSGFYYIARQANIPVVLSFIDYRRKILGFGKMMTLTGDMEADLDVMRSFYAGVTGKYPDQHGEIRFRPRHSEPDEPSRP